MPCLHFRERPSSRYRIAWLACVLFLSACASEPAVPPTSEKPLPALPPAPVFVVDTDRSEIRVLVRRDGPLARFGHNHVLVAPVHGVIHAGDTSAQSGFSLQVAVNEFVVDPPAAREEEGDEFLAEVTDAARLATRGNLLGDAVLDAARFPAIALESVSMLGPRWNPSVTARLTLHGIARDVTFPAAVVERDGELIVVASFRVNQSAFGIEPFSILGGGLSVQDQLRIRARIVAARE